MDFLGRFFGFLFEIDGLCFCGYLEEFHGFLRFFKVILRKFMDFSGFS